MRRFLLVMFVAASATYADSTASASCTAGTTTQTVTGPTFSSCSLLLGQDGVVVADANVTEFVTGNTYNVLNDAVVVEQSEHGGPEYSATANANVSLELGSDGPKRPGFIQFDIQNSVFNIFQPDIVTISELFTDGVNQYSYQNSTGSTPGVCNSSGCEFKETLPFDLGSAFYISISVESAIADGAADASNKASGNPIVTFSLLESDGKTSVPLFVTPEPSSWGLFLFGLLARSWLRVKRDAPAPPA